MQSLSLFQKKRNRRSNIRKAGAILRPYIPSRSQSHKVTSRKIGWEGEGKVKAEVKGQINFCESREGFLPSCYLKAVKLTTF